MTGNSHGENPHEVRRLRIAFATFTAVLLAGCVSVEPQLGLGETQQSLNNQSGLVGVSSQANSTVNAPNGQVLASGNPLPEQQAGNIPVAAPRGQAAVQPTTALAIADPAQTTLPAQQVIAAATQETPAVTPETRATSTTDAGLQTATGEPTPPSSSEVAPEPAENLQQQASLAVAAEPPKPKRVNLARQRAGRGDSAGRISSAHKTSRSPSRSVSKTQVASAFASPQVTSTATSVSTTPPSSTVSRDSAGNLPGVKSSSEIFGIEDEPEADGFDVTGSGATQLASAAGLGSLSPNGLRVQHDKVQVACLKPGVLQILKIVERKYGKKPIITSGYRSPKRNRRAGGAKNSQHIFCKAVDIQVEGVSKWDLASYLRTIPGRGGVGTYCRTKSVHIDIGSKRDWHHPCRRSAKRKKKA
ncbi:MAG: D-Ala-D-Ala carboxypeptidase family metallohydrolase [Pseudomonadota bacterium]